MAKDRDDDGGGFTGKRNKSWREIDAARGKQQVPLAPGRPRAAADRAQRQLRQVQGAADALFTGGELPEGLAKTFDPEGKRKAQKDAMLKLRELPDRKAWVQGVRGLPGEVPGAARGRYFLDSLLDHPRERIVDKALAKLEAAARRASSRRRCPRAWTSGSSRSS